MSGVNEQNAILREQSRIRDEIMRLNVDGLLDINDSEHPEPDAIRFNDRVYLKAVDVLKIIGYEDREIPVKVKGRKL